MISSSSLLGRRRQHSIQFNSIQFNSIQNHLFYNKNNPTSFWQTNWYPSVAYVVLQFCILNISTSKVEKLWLQKVQRSRRYRWQVNSIVYMHSFGNVYKQQTNTCRQTSKQIKVNLVQQLAEILLTLENVLVHEWIPVNRLLRQMCIFRVRHIS